MAASLGLRDKVAVCIEKNTSIKIIT